jgi:hypothetical protein
MFRDRVAGPRAWFQVPARHQAGLHTNAAHEAITAELVRLTLGGKPDRPELQVS